MTTKEFCRHGCGNIVRPGLESRTLDFEAEGLSLARRGIQLRTTVLRPWKGLELLGQSELVTGGQQLPQLLGWKECFLL